MVIDQWSLQAFPSMHSELVALELVCAHVQLLPLPPLFSNFKLAHVHMATLLEQRGQYQLAKATAIGKLVSSGIDTAKLGSGFTYAPCLELAFAFIHEDYLD